jgi:hypothetical protein
VAEGGRARRALGRSVDLVGGQWWHTFGTVVLSWVLIGLVVALVGNAAGGFGHGWLAETVAQALSLTLVTPFAALVGVLLYLDLRARQETRDGEPRHHPRASGA